MQTVFDLLKLGRGDPSPTVEKRCKSVGRGLAPAAKYDRGTAGRRGADPYGGEAVQIGRAG